MGKLWTNDAVEIFMGLSTGIRGFPLVSRGRPVCSYVFEILFNMAVVHNPAPTHPQ